MQKFRVYLDSGRVTWQSVNFTMGNEVQEAFYDNDKSYDCFFPQH